MAWQCLDKIVVIAGGCLVAATKGLDATSGLGAAVGLASLVGFFGERGARHGPESQDNLAKIQAAVVKELGDPPEWPGADPHTVSGWEWSLGQALPLCLLDRQALAASIFDGDGFPVAAARLVLFELETREPIFSEAPARDFAHRVISAALTAAFEDREYFKSLAPYLWAELGRKMDKLDETTSAIYNQQIAQSLLIDRLAEEISALNSDKQTNTGIVEERMVFEKKIFLGISIGWHIGRLEFTIGHDMPQAVIITNNLKELLIDSECGSEHNNKSIILHAECVRPIAELFLKFYGERDLIIHSSILVGISGQRLLLANSTANDKNKAELFLLARSALIDVNPMIIENIDNFLFEIEHLADISISRLTYVLTQRLFRPRIHGHASKSG